MLKEQSVDMHICLISDDNYVIPTCVAMQSIKESMSPDEVYCVHIVASALTDTTVAQLYALEEDNFLIEVLQVDAKTQFDGMHIFQDDSICVASIAALFKFLLPILFPTLDKILYLDGDLIVRQNLKELYNTDLSGHYAAAVIDSGVMYYSYDFYTRVASYFNSGVMLLNLGLMREDGLSQVLLETKKSLLDNTLMDQNVFNLVFDKKYKPLPIKYNFLPVSLYFAYDLWSIEQVNTYYGTAYKNKRELFDDAAILHYSSKNKPWKDMDGACASEWISVYLRTPISHDLIQLQVESMPEITAILPCCNDEKTVRGVLDSVLAQTYTNFEIICLDDGSAAQTLPILREYEAKHHNIRVVSTHHSEKSAQYNLGIELAKGRFLCYLDGFHQLSADCFRVAHEYARNNRLDLLCFAGEMLNCTNHPYPEVYTGANLYALLYREQELFTAPCTQFIRRAFVTENSLFFPETPVLADELYTIQVLLGASRVKIISNRFFFKTIPENATTAPTNPLEKIRGISLGIQKLFEGYCRFTDNHDVRTALYGHIQEFYAILHEEYTKLSPEQLQHFNESSDSMLKQQTALSQMILQGKEEVNVHIASLSAVINSPSYKVGRLITLLPRKIRECLTLTKEKGLAYAISRLFKKN